MLEVLGLSPEEETIYRRLVGRSSTSGDDLASDLPQRTRDAALESLVNRGLASRDAHGRLIAAPPAVALSSLITQHREGLRAAELALGALAEEHRAATAGRTIDELIEVVTGKDAVRHRFLQLLEAAQRQVRTFVTAPFVAVSPADNPAEKAAVQRGVRIRSVLEKAALAAPGVLAETEWSLRNGLEVRVVDELPIKLVLADSDLALVPLATTQDSEPGSVLLQRSGLVAALDALFEAVWRDAYPLRLDGDDVVEDVPGETSSLDRKILMLMLAGMTDQAVAAQLDISVRTLQRRVRDLMDLAGAKSRMQLAWHAARNGWA